MAPSNPVIAPGVKARVSGFLGQANHAQKSLRTRLYTLGLRPGTEFEVVQFAPLGDPVQIKVQGLLIGLRRMELECLQFDVV